MEGWKHSLNTREALKLLNESFRHYRFPDSTNLSVQTSSSETVHRFIEIFT